MNYRADIDGLRAVAVLSVILYHAGVALPGGYVGVDVFFVISGYLIAGVMLKDMRAGAFSLAHFWERRIRRILPALCVVVAASFVLGWFLLLPKTYELFGRSVIHLMLLRSNAYFCRMGDYFAAGVDEKPLLHTWSLSVEEQFYLLIPLLFWGAMRLRRQAWLGPIVGVLAAVSFGYNVYGTTMWSQQAYYGLSTRAWEILAGMLTAMFVHERLQVARSVRECAAVLGLAGVAVPCFLYDATTAFPGMAALAPVLGTVLLIVIGGSGGGDTWVHRLLASRPAVGIGLISYSLYLWHWPLIVFVKHHSELLLSALGRGLLVALSVVLAFLTYRYVEHPFRRGDLLQTRPHLFAATACVFICLLSGGLVLRHSGGIVDRLPQRAQLFARTGELNNSYARIHRAEDVPDNLSRAGAEDVEPKLLVWGDSHAGVVMPVIHEMCLSAGVAARCAMCPMRPPVMQHCTQTSPEALAEANAFGAAVVRYAKSSEVDAVLLVGLWNAYFSHSQFADSLLRTIDELRAAGLKVYFLKDVPHYEFDVAAALIADEWRGSDVSALSFSLADYDAQNRYHETILPLLAERDVTILDPIPFLRIGAAADEIPAFDAGGSFYCDTNHLSVYGVRAIQGVFTPVIDDVAQSSMARLPKKRRNPTAVEDSAAQPSRLR